MISKIIHPIDLSYMLSSMHFLVCRPPCLAVIGGRKVKGLNKKYTYKTALLPEIIQLNIFSSKAFFIGECLFSVKDK